jgi:hypothetical protein
MPKNEVGDYTGGEFPKKKKTGILNEEDITELQRRRNQVFQDIGSPAKKEEV